MRGDLGIRGQQVVGVFGSSYLGQGAAFLKHTASKLFAPWDKNSSELMALLERSVLQTNSVWWLDNLELTTLPDGLTNGVDASLHLCMSNI